MGATLPKAVESTVVEEHVGKGFKVGLAEMNGWRNNMEDAHLAHMKDDWGFFGVFDGHGGEACSAFVAKRLKEELGANGCPADDAAVKELVFRLDKEFLDSSTPSGSTATMCIVNKPTQVGDKHKLRVMNIGDSRVLLGRRDGSIVDGAGTDQGLTTDHKPDHPSERERIYRCGGTVETKEGNCARVNGDLAVSRAFGDREYKKTGGPGQEDHPVTSNPEFGNFECDASDFLLLVCDGVSEGSFTNPEVVELAARLLREGKDPGAVARAIIFRALETDSKDNISCMVVLFEDGEIQDVVVEFTPGPCTHLSKKNFKTAYEAMASRAKFTLAQAVEMRYELALALPSETLSASLREEKEKIGKPTGDKGSDDRAQWFQQWVANLPEDAEDNGMGGMDMASLMSSMGKGGGPSKGKGKGGKAKSAEAIPDAEKEVEKTEDGYTWSQKGEEIQIAFKLPAVAAKKDVKVAFKQSTLQVTAHGEKLLDGALGGKVEVDECTWCLAGGGAELQVMLTKQDAASQWGGLLK